ncbi:MAG: hypothetical protein ACJA09_002729 [Alcanivorax sp.]|jgi:hypothetical protein
MDKIKSIYSALFLTLALATTGSHAADVEILPETEGLWEYTDLITSKGESLPLTGVFLIKDGVFLQQSIYNGGAFSEQGSMAHAGTCWAGGAGLRLTSIQTLSMSPVDDERLSSMGTMEHDLKVTRDGDDLTLVFGGGTSTIQTFKKINDASNTRIYPFAHGRLALTNDYFILVAGNAEDAVTGYGTYTQEGDALTLNVIRWAQSDGKTTNNIQDTTLRASFDGSVLSLPDGKSFPVVQ